MSGIILRGAVALVFLIVAFVLFGQSAFGYLKTGEWHSDSVLDAITYFFERPDGRVSSFFSDWVGLAEILGSFPAYLASFVLSMIVLAADLD
ncbi:hypothetical protein [Pararhizobium sp. LjRoot238]|uniref:hypothetical protein n=1 Tax=Pararhizobium sp. LjRoot238 TaxID=3342293 RepID=UPI003ED07ACB